MEAYPSEYYEHNLPLVLLSGLVGDQSNVPDQSTPHRQETGVKVSSSSPQCQGEQAQRLLQELLAQDGSNLAWNSSSLPGPTGALKYKIKAIGRSYSLPPRKAAPLAQSPSGEGFELHHSSPQRNIELHSPFSPLSPGSPICPDGVFTPLWMKKHQQQVPALFMSFFRISSSDDGSNDETIKNDINSIRTSLSRSGFKSRFAAVLLSDQSIVRAPELEERLASIRRATSLDSKNGFFFMPPMSSESEIHTFVQAILAPLQPLCVEYYRDLTKHARRKKARGGPPTSATSPIGVGAQILSTSGWYLRYEFKQGVFAEFRQEMDVAERHYSAAIEDLFNAEGVLEFTPSWSPRWSEARLLGDCLALRILRCQLWVGATTGAVQSWDNYRTRMRDVVNRRGKGSKTHSWNAWETRWAKVMAQLIERAEIPAFSAALSDGTKSSELAFNRVYVPPENSYQASERLPPFYALHHSGYWHRRSAISARARRERALNIPDEDRTPPGQSPASTVAKRHASYDTYLVPDPHEEFPLPGNDGYDHLGDIVAHFDNSTSRFDQSGQPRMSELSRLEVLQDLIKVEKYSEALPLISALWDKSTWRREGWLDIFAELLKLMHLCGTHESNAEAVLGVTYELLSLPSNLPSSQPPDLARCLDEIELAPSTPIRLTYENNQRLSPISVHFAFASKEGYVGEPLSAQIVMASSAAAGSAPVCLSNASFSIGSSKKISITHTAGSELAVGDAGVVQLDVSSDQSDATSEASTDLSFSAGQQRIFDVHLTFREPGPILLGEVVIHLETERFHIDHRFNEQAELKADSILSFHNGVLHRTRLPQAETTTVTVLPKPPKVQIQPKKLRRHYYTDESIEVQVDIVNAETEPVTGTVKAQIGVEAEIKPRLGWLIDDKSDPLPPGKSASINISDVAASATSNLTLLIQAPRESTSVSINIDVEYTLASDPSTALDKTLTISMDFAKPLDAKFNFGPLLYPEAWPSLFQANGIGSKSEASGIPQIWRLSSQVRSVATENIFVHGTELALDRVIGDAEATAREQEPFDQQNLRPGNVVRSFFELHTRKTSLDDRRATSMESTLAVTWSRDENSKRIVTKLPVPQLTLPVSEPRVLCTLDDNIPEDADAVVRYHVENPSAHFLTFALTMEASDEFAFSGPKYRALSLAPLSRHHVEYRIALYDQQSSPTTKEEGGRWISPNLQVIDSFYNKQLRVHAGGQGVRADEKGVVSVWIEAP